MGLFWSYFKDTLRWPLVRVSGPLAAQVAGAAGALDQAREDILWLRRQFNPATCEDQYLVYHGAARGLSRYRLESVDQFRARVVNAYAWQLLGGKVGGMPQILEDYGFTGAEIVNLRNEDPLRWAEFRINLPPRAGGLSAEEYELFNWLVNDQKPARSKLAGLRFEVTVQTALTFQGWTAMRPALTIGPYVAGVSVAGSTFYLGGGVHAVARISIDMVA